jgi:hypothetical protein
LAIYLDERLQKIWTFRRDWLKYVG